MFVEFIVAALAGGGVSALVTSLVTSWAVRKKIRAEAEEAEERIRTSVIASLQKHVDFQNAQIEKLQDRIKLVEEENILLRKKNKELESRLEKYESRSDTGYHEVLDVKRSQ